MITYFMTSSRTFAQRKRPREPNRPNGYRAHLRFSAGACSVIRSGERYSLGLGVDRAKVGGRTSEDITTETPDETVGTIIIQRIVRGIRQPDIAIGRLGQQGDIPHDGTDGIGT